MSAPFNLAELNRALFAMRIPHGNFKDAFELGKELFELKDQGMPGSGFLVMGSSGVGKTTLTFALLEYGQKHYGPDSVLRTQLSGGATAKSIKANLLYGFGDGQSDSKSEWRLEGRLVNAIKERDCRLILIDETQHLFPGDDPTKKQIDSILNSFKILDKTGVSIVLAGLESLELLWKQDKQTRGRFQTAYFLNALKYPQDRPAWRGIVRKFLSKMNEFGVTVECPDLEDRLFAACQGAMRPLILILTTANIIAAKAGTSVITVDHLRKAAQKQIDELDGMPNAFDIDLETITRANRVGNTERKLAPVNRGIANIVAT